MKIKLNHHCHMLGAEGGPGDVIECDARIGKLIIDRRGATEVAVAKGPPVPVPEVEPEVETATRPAPENQAERTAKPSNPAKPAKRRK